MPGVQCTISAELDKLNVYRAGDFFKRHVDTPSSSSLLGTLVVCLPVPHAGGGLAVSHDGRRAVFDWGPGAARGEVQWAAFFSNCHHEVLPVTEGARLTVTYERAGTRPRRCTTLLVTGDGQAHRWARWA